MKKFLFLIIALATLAVLWAVWPSSRVWIFLGLILWAFLAFGTWLWLLFVNDEVYKPKPWGTRYQKQEFWRVVCFGPIMILFSSPATSSGDPTSAAPLSK
jgi:hypothetical protein